MAGAHPAAGDLAAGLATAPSAQLALTAAYKPALRLKRGLQDLSSRDDGFADFGFAGSFEFDRYVYGTRQCLQYRLVCVSSSFGDWPACRFAKIESGRSCNPL